MRKVQRSDAWKSLATIAALSATTVLPAQAMPATWYVSNYGDDAYNTPSCGVSKTLPCRSISKAISLAATGDIIIVGPGVYGDLNGNGTFDASPSGDEAAEIGSGCECMIKVDKSLTIVSRDGAEVTILEAGGLTQSVVHIVPAANGAVFGKLNKGFTIRGGADSGLLTDSSSQKVKIQGNIALGNDTGFDVDGLGGTGTGNAMIVAHNVATENTGDGFVLSGTFNTMQHNRAVSNDGAGFVVNPNGHFVVQDVAVGNDKGFQPNVSTMFSPFRSNPIDGFTKNSAIGNSTAGVFLEITAAGGVFLDQANLFGNGDPANNCGLATNASVSGTTAGFAENYWGAATGVGPNPADDGGGAAAACNTGVGSSFFSVVAPLPKEVTVSEAALK